MNLRIPSTVGERYSPLYFLAALGSGGMTANFFIWLLFWVPHSGHSMPLFEDISTAYATGTRLMRLAIGLAMSGIALFALLHLLLMLWNLVEFGRYRHTAAARLLRSGNTETQLLALPLTVAMTINVTFIVGTVFVPGLGSMQETLFPAAMVSFLLVGIWALRLLGDFYARVLTQGGFDCARNNSFAQMLPAFALAMIGVGLAAPAMLSVTPWIAGVSYLLSNFFIVTALLLGTVHLVFGMRSMMKIGANIESAPTLWITVPILTITTITFLRQGYSAHIHFGDQATAFNEFNLITVALSAQVAFLLLGWVVLRRHDYFRRFVFSREVSSGSWALICPGVAFGLMLHLFTNKGLVAVGLIDKYNLAYWILSGLALAVQMSTIALMLRLAITHLSAWRADSVVYEP